MMRRWLVASLGGLVAFGLVGCTPLGADDPGSTYAPIAVKQVRKMPAAATIGVIYSSVGQGSDWWQSANGAAIAEYRLRLGGTKVTLVAIDDHGASAQALEAVRRLVGVGASGIVIASEGNHLTGALEAASTAQIPVLLPYYAPATLPIGVWTTAPTEADLSSALPRALDRLKATAPLVIEADGQRVPGASSPYTVAYTGSNAEEITTMITSLSILGQINSVVLAGSAQSEAALVRLVQGIPHYASPIIVMTHALSPLFATDLVRKHHGHTDGTLATVGVSTGQFAAFSQTEAGEQAAAFYNAVNMAATAPKGSFAAVTALNGQALSAGVELVADTQSHDAVMALVDAIQSAKSLVPRKVLQTLSSLSLGADEGLAGPSLSFDTQHALDASSIVLMNSTPQAPNVVHAPTATAVEAGTGADLPVPLYWFAAPGQ